MTEEKQNSEGFLDKLGTSGANKTEGKNVCCGICKKIRPDLLKKIIIGFVGFALVVLIFGAGVFVGTMKAKFSYRWAENYHKNFAGPSGGFFDNLQNFPKGDFIESHGVFGEIIEIKDNGFVIKGKGDIEKVIVVSRDTVIKQGKETIKDGLKVGDSVVIIGSPNEKGQIEAKLIRFLPFPSAMPSQPSFLTPER